MTLEDRVAALERIVAAQQIAINSMAVKMTVKQAALLTDSQIDDLTTKVNNLTNQVAILLART